MAGRPKRRAVRDELERRSKEYFEVEEGQDNPHSTLDYVVALTERGTTLTELAEDISGSIQTEIGRELITAYLRSAFNDAEIRLAEARALASHSLVEQAIKLVDQPANSNVAVARAASRARTRQWTAERWNPKEMGQNKQAGVTLNIGNLHLTALQKPHELASSSSPQHAPARVSLPAIEADRLVDGANSMTITGGDQ